MTHILARGKYRTALRWTAEVAKTFGLWALIALVSLHLVQLGLRLAIGFEGDYSQLVLRFGPFLLTAIGWVYLIKAFPLALTTGMTRKEFFAAFAVFGGAVIAASVAFMWLVRIGYNLSGAAAFGSLDLGGAALLETLIRSAVYFAAGAAAGAVMARFGARTLGAVLAGLVISVLLFRPIPFELWSTEFGGGGTIVLEFPGSEELFAPFDSVLAFAFALLAWAALRNAPMPPKSA